MDRRELTQGKCEKCKVAFRWPSKGLRLRDADCPRCKTKLSRTTHLLKWPWITQAPASVHDAIKVGMGR